MSKHAFRNRGGCLSLGVHGFVVEPDAVFELTDEQIEAYLPDLAHFKDRLEHLGEVKPPEPVEAEPVSTDADTLAEMLAHECDEHAATKVELETALAALNDAKSHAGDAEESLSLAHAEIERLQSELASLKATATPAGA